MAGAVVSVRTLAVMVPREEEVSAGLFMAA
jgi:hypothetical protein